jgi:hypothetical protein
VPANDIGGAVDIRISRRPASIASRCCAARTACSTATDALSGVINITTARGQTPRSPAASFSVDGGNLGTSHEDASIGGAVRRFDYFAPSRTCRPRTTCRTTTTEQYVCHRAGVVLGASTSLSGTVRRIGTSLGSPNAFSYFGIADDASQERTTTYTSIAAQIAVVAAVDEHACASASRSGLPLCQPVADRRAVRPVTVRELPRQPVTISREGRPSAARAILDFGGDLSVALRRRRLATAALRATRLPCDVSRSTIAGGVRVEDEHGASGTTSKTSRTNSGAFVEGARRSARLICT